MNLFVDGCHMLHKEQYKERDTILSKEPTIGRLPSGYLYYYTIKNHPQDEYIAVHYKRGICLTKDSLHFIIFSNKNFLRVHQGKGVESKILASRYETLFDTVFRKNQQHCYIRSLSRILILLEFLDVRMSYFASRNESERIIRKSKLFRQIENFLSDNGLEITDISYDYWFEAGENTGEIYLDISEIHKNQ